MSAKNKGGRPTKRPDAQWLMNIYQSYTAQDIADMFDVSVNTVYSWIHRIKKAEGK